MRSEMLEHVPEFLKNHLHDLLSTTVDKLLSLCARKMRSWDESPWMSSRFTTATCTGTSAVCSSARREKRSYELSFIFSRISVTTYCTGTSAATTSSCTWETQSLTICFTMRSEMCFERDRERAHHFNISLLVGVHRRQTPLLGVSP